MEKADVTHFKETSQRGQPYRAEVSDITEDNPDITEDNPPSDISSEEEDTFCSEAKETKLPTYIYGRRFSNVSYLNLSIDGQHELEVPRLEQKLRPPVHVFRRRHSDASCANHLFDHVSEQTSPKSESEKSRQPFYIYGRRLSNASVGYLSMDSPFEDIEHNGWRCRSNSDSSDGVSYDGTLENVSNRVYIALFWNTFGRKGKDSGEFGDATHIHHIYNGVTIITDRSNNRLQVFSKTGKFKYEVDMGIKSHPASSVITKCGDIACTLPERGRVAILDMNGNKRKMIENNNFKSPSGIAVDNKNMLYVTDPNANKVFIVHLNGSVIGCLGQNHGETFSNPRHVTICKFSQNVLVSDSGNNCIKVFDNYGTLLRKFGCYGRGDGQFRFPCGITTDIRGNILVADHYNDRVSLFSPLGEFLHHLVGPERNVKRPQGIELRLGKRNPKLYVTHGDILASKVSVFKLRDPMMDNVTVEVQAKV